MGQLKMVLIALTIAALVCGMMAMGASSRMEARWALQTGDIITGNDISIEHPMSVLFHQQAVSALDLENAKLSFPAALDFNAADSPVSGIDLALPSISQDVDQSIQESSTGFFSANWAYIVDMASANAGNLPLGVSFDNLHPYRSNKMLGSEYLWPYITPLPAASSDSHKLSMSADGDLFNTTGGMDSAAPANATRLNAPSGANSTSNITAPTLGSASSNNSTNNSTSSQGQRKPRVDPRSTTDQIKNMGDMQRLYRNAFIGSTMYKAYEGPTQYPTSIDPYDKGKGVFNEPDMPKILKLAHNETLPGKHIAPAFWDL